jgi:preprotein translocase subunit SecG
MSAIIVIIHVIVCLALIMIVLLQTGKGADMGASFGGGGSQTLFGSSGASTFLSKATTVAAVIFMITCFTLAWLSTHKTPKSIMKDTKAPTAQEEKLPVDMPITQDTKVPSAQAPAIQAEDKAKPAQKEAKAPSEQAASEKGTEKSAATE